MAAALEEFDTSSDISSTFSLADGISCIGIGDALSLIQAVGFGIGIVSSTTVSSVHAPQFSDYGQPSH